MEVRKRNGQVVPYNVENIRKAISKAFESLNNKCSKNILDYLIISIENDLFSEYNDGVTDIETIQDLVEETLMKFNYFQVAKAYILYRKKHQEIREGKNITTKSIEFSQKLIELAEASSKQFDNDPMREFIYMRTYSRWIENENRREFWQETVERFVNFIKSKLGKKLSDDEYNLIFEYVFEQKVMPSMRLLQFAGPAAERCNVCVYNCAFTAPSSFKDLADIMYLSMSGTGVGFTVEKSNVEKFPEISRYRYEHSIYEFDIEDSKEGWCDALQYCLEKSFGGERVNFDFSKLRPKGARCYTSGGRSSGPGPLKDLLKFIPQIVDERRKSGHRKLSTLDVHDIICKIGQIVVAGGVRRCIAKGSKVITGVDSFKNIEEIQIGDMVITNDGWKPVTAVSIQGEQEILEIHHQEGILKCTPNHRIAVFDKINFDPIWKEAKDLTKDDVLGFPLRDRNMALNQINIGLNRMPYFKYVYPPHSTTCKAIVIPPLDLEMAWFIGNFQGDGYVLLTSKSGQLSVAIHADEIPIKEMVELQFKRFGVNTGLTKPKKSDNSFKVTVKSKQLATFLYTHVKQPKTPLKVPLFIKMASPAIKAAFVQGLMDADGSIKTRPVIIVTTVYRDYALEIQALLMSIGIVTRFKELKQPKEEKWQQKFNIVIINNRDKSLFNTYAPSFGYKKMPIKDKVQRANGWMKSQIMANPGFVKPNGWHQKVAPGTKECNVPLDSLSNYFGIESQILPIKIKKIVRTGEIAPTYDIEVEDNHNFVCSGVLVHNSALISLSDLDDDKMRDCKSGPFWNNNSQRFLANNSAAYNVKPSQIDFMSEWIALAKSGSGERGIFNRSGLRSILPKCRVEFLGDKIDTLGTNPCVTIDTLIMTPNGYKPVSELLGKRSNLLVEGEIHQTTDYGFFKKGSEMVYELAVKKGNETKIIKCSSTHRVYKAFAHDNLEVNCWSKMKWTALSDLNEGDYVAMADHNIEEKCVEFESFGFIISIIPLDEQDVYDCTIDSETVHWYDSNGILSHNCGEILLQPFQFCNLTEVVCRSDDTKESLHEKIRVATIIGTIQSSLSDFKYIDPKWKKNQDDERLLGVSLTGIYDCPYLTDPTILKELRYHAIKINEEYSQKLGINVSHAITTVKPSGTVSQMVNSSSGIHPRFDKYYIRRVRISSTDPLLQLMKSEGYECKPEVGQVEPNVNTYVLEFPVKSPEGCITVNDVTTIQQLEHWKRYKTLYTQHNPSATIYIKPDEWLLTGLWVWDNWDIIVGLSFLPYSDHVYELAPYESITQKTYEEMLKTIKKPNFLNLLNIEKEDNTDVKKELACVGGVCEL